jgi:hypothetical protein
VAAESDATGVAEVLAMMSPPEIVF